MPFPVHSLTLKNAQFDIISEHLLVGICLSCYTSPEMYENLLGWMRHSASQWKMQQSRSEKAPHTKHTEKMRGKSPILVPLSFLEQLHFSSHESREEFYLGVRNTVLLQGCFYVLLGWLARSIFFKNGFRTLLSFAPRNVFI